MQALDFKNKRVLITGASSGLGREMARQLARQHGAHPVLVARRRTELEQLRAELETDAPGIRCEVMVADLSDPEQVQRVFETVTAQPLYAAILNAGVTHFGPYDQLDWGGFQRLLATNVSSVVQLNQQLLPYLMAQGTQGGVMLIASVAGLLPVPFQAAYSGSKGFIVNYGLGIQQELRGQPVSLTVFAPGGIDTAMTRDSALRFFSDTPLMQSCERCATEALHAFRRRRGLQVPGLLNRLQLLATRLAPRSLVQRITYTAYRKALPKD